MAAPIEVLLPVLEPVAVLLLLALCLALALRLPLRLREAPLPRVASVVLVGRLNATAAPTAVPPAEPATALLFMVLLEEALRVMLPALVTVTLSSTWARLLLLTMFKATEAPTPTEPLASALLAREEALTLLLELLTAVRVSAPVLRMRVLPGPTCAWSWLVTMLTARAPATPTPLMPLAPETAWAL